MYQSKVSKSESYTYQQYESSKSRDKTEKNKEDSKPVHDAAPLAPPIEPTPPKSPPKSPLLYDSHQISDSESSLNAYENAHPHAQQLQLKQYPGDDSMSDAERNKLVASFRVEDFL